MIKGGKFKFSEEYKIKNELTISTKLGLSDAPILLISGLEKVLI